MDTKIWTGSSGCRGIITERRGIDKWVDAPRMHKVIYERLDRQVDRAREMSGNTVRVVSLWQIRRASLSMKPSTSRKRFDITAWHARTFANGLQFSKGIFGYWVCAFLADTSKPKWLSVTVYRVGYFPDLFIHLFIYTPLNIYNYVTTCTSGWCYHCYVISMKVLKEHYDIITSL